VVEPGALGATFLGGEFDPSAGQRAREYKEGIMYVLEQLGSLSNVALYLDAMHGGLSGWNDNLSLT
jgi:cellulase/cellobiase CelA1